MCLNKKNNIMHFILSLSRQSILTFVLFSLSTVMVLAQPGRNFQMSCEGIVVDSKTSEPLVGAAVKVTSADGGTGTFGISDSNGKFTFEVNHPGKYTLEFTYVSYKTLHKEVNIFPNRTKLGTFKMKEDPHVLAEVETIGHSQRIKQKGDTLAYNADAYKVQDGATADELIAKMPGIEVTSDGVKAQGETVQKVLVDGKEFFDNDPKLALKSLPAEVVESVNVYDKKSDQAEFTGIDDGNTYKAMDLTTKSYRRNGIFGKVYGSLGSNFDWNQGYWNAGFNLNVFNGNNRISLLGMSNNINQTNFSFEDMAASGGMMMRGRGGGGGWGQPSGVSRANALGINYSNQLFDDKLDMQLNYFFNQVRTYSEDSTLTDDLNRSLASISQSESLSHKITHNLGGRIRYSISETDEIMIRPSLSFQSGDANSMSEETSWNNHLDDVLADPNIPYSAYSKTQTNSEDKSWDIGGNLLWRHRFKTLGRTLSMNIEGRLSSGSQDRDVVKDYSFNPTRLYERVNSDTENSSWGGNVQWTEPLTTHSQLSFRYDYGQSKSRNDNVDDYYDADFRQFAHHDTLNTSIYEQRNTRHTGELGWALNRGSLRVNAGIRAQSSHLEGEQDFYLMPSATENFTTSKDYFSILPNVRVEYRSENGTQFQFNYRTSASNPSVSRLQKSVNTTNQLRYSTGNPDLDQSISHRLNLRMIYTNTETAQNFMVFGGYNISQDPIGTMSLRNTSGKALDLSTLGNTNYSEWAYQDLSLAPSASFSRPYNSSTSQSANLAIVYGFPFDLIWSNVNVSLNGNYSSSPACRFYFEGNYDKSGAPVIVEQATKTRTLGFSPRLHVTSNISADLNFGLEYSPSFQWVDDPLNESTDRDYLTHRLNANLNWTFWEGFTTEHSANYTYYGGPSMTEAISEVVWNASIGKKFLKGNKAELKLQINDVLGTRKGYSYSVGDTSVTTSYVNFMPRYFLLTFTYKLSAYRGNGGSSQSNSGNRGSRGGFGGPGGGFGGPGPGGPF